LEHYDCAVIGAGPAGCAAARVLAAGGFKTALLEKEALPRQKACGGSLSSNAVEWLEERFGPMPEELRRRCFPLAGLRVVRGGARYDLPYRPSRLVVPRPEFDFWLARRCGAQLLEGAEVTELQAERFANRLQVREGGRQFELGATFVVAADGGASGVLRRLRPEFSRLYQLPNLVSIDFFLFPQVPGEERWRGVLVAGRPPRALRVQPVAGSLGLAVPLPPGESSGEVLGAALPELRRHFGLEAEGPVSHRPAVLNRMGMLGLFSPGAGSVLLAGEAAGLLDPWGDGIETALLCGEEAGRAAVDCAGEKVLPHAFYAERLKGLLLDLEDSRRGRRPAGDLLLQGSPLDPRGLTGRRRYRYLLKVLAGP